MQYRPGSVTGTPLLIARLGGAAPWEWLRGAVTGLPHDGDVTCEYHDTLARHLLNGAHGVNTTLVLWGDQQWHATVADADILDIVRRCVAGLRSPEGGAVTRPDGTRMVVQRLVFVTQTFSCTTGGFHEVVRRELSGPEAAAGLRGVLPASDARTLALVKLVAAVGDCEAVLSVVVPPPYDACAWDVHAYLRGPDEAVLATNALKAVVLHCGTAEPPHGEVRETLDMMRRRVGAPVPNTPATRHLLALLAEQAKRPPEAESGPDGHAEWGRKRTDALHADVEALESELVSTRAAFVAAQQRAQELEISLRGARPAAAEPLLLDPPTIERELLRMAEDQMNVLSNDLPQLWRRVGRIESGAGGPSDARVKELAQWRAREAEALTQALSKAPMTVLQGGLLIPAGARVAPDNPVLPSAVLRPGAKNNSNKGDDDDDEAPYSAGGMEGRGLDPVAVFFQDRLAAFEVDVATASTIDVKASVDDYFVRELEAAQRELAQWIARCREAERKRDEYERAVKRSTGAIM